jgi:RNA polymerase sigma-70 factor (ECF subfamily)
MPAALLGRCRGRTIARVSGNTGQHRGASKPAVPTSVSSDTWAEWIHAAVAGDRHALQKILVMYHPRLRARLEQLMGQRLRSRLEPEDILQQVYLDVYQRISEFEYRGGQSFYRWVLTIARHKLIDAQRVHRASRRDVAREAPKAPLPGRSESWLSLSRLVADSVTPSRVARKSEAEHALAVSLAALPKHYQRVIRLRYLQGRPVAEVAQRMKRSEGAIHMLCQRALKQLRRQMLQMDVGLD